MDSITSQKSIQCLKPLSSMLFSSFMLISSVEQNWYVKDYDYVKERVCVCACALAFNFNFHQLPPLSRFSCVRHKNRCLSGSKYGNEGRPFSVPLSQRKKTILQLNSAFVSQGKGLNIGLLHCLGLMNFEVNYFRVCIFLL